MLENSQTIELLLCSNTHCDHHIALMMIESKRSLQLPHMFILVFLLLCMKSTTLCLELTEINNTTFTKCLERERRALLLFKEDLVDDYDRLVSWGSEEDCCKWRGVSCDHRSGHVIKLDLRALYNFSEYSYTNSVRGKISPSLLELWHLKYLDLSGNDFKYKPIPHFICSFSKLEYLNLSYASFHGPLPYNFGNLSNLQQLDLSSNSFGDSPIPNSIGSITNLKYLYLSGADFAGPLPYNFKNLSNLQHLDLSSNRFGSNPIPNFIGSITNLKYLDLSYADFVGTVPCQLGNLSKLYYLDLSSNRNYTTVDNIRWLFHLSSLTYLDMSGVDLSRAIEWVDIFNRLPFLPHLNLFGCELSGVISPSSSLNNSSTLVSLELGSNNLEGPIPDAWGNMTSLSYLSLSGNELEGVIPYSFMNICKLRSLDLSSNNLSGNLSDSLQNLSCAEDSLEELDLSYNKLTGTLSNITRFSSLKNLLLHHNLLHGVLPKTFGQLSNLEILYVSSNSMDGVISELHFLNLPRLTYLDLSLNSFVFDFSSQWVPPFQLERVQLKSCKLGPRFPKWLQTQRNIRWLDLSNSGIDTIPTWFWNQSTTELIYLNLSSNQIRGKLPELSTNLFVTYPEIDLSSNWLEGHISILPFNVTALNLSRNNFSGTLSFLCSITIQTITFLDLSHNHLSGELPNCLVRFHKLVYLNLANNRLFGTIPRSVASMFSLETLILRNNNFSGELPLSMRNCTSLRFMDLGANKLSGNIPSWIGKHLTELYGLSLQSNKFHGTIPLHLCHLTKLQFLDLSINNISGTIPQCFINLTAMVQKKNSLDITNHVYASSWDNFESSSSVVSFYIDVASVVWNGREFEFGSNLGLLKVIDVSSNKLTGDFPQALTSLVELVALNLSRNNFYGIVPPTIGQMKSLIYLDLSRNRFSGPIPRSMSELHFLGNLDLSYNNFSGRIPLGTQLQSFDASKFTGNSELCGPPLTPKCPGDETTQVPSTMEGDENVQEDEDEFWKCFYIGTALGFSIGFWGICCTLFINRRWRHAYFLLLHNLKDWLYVTLIVNIAKFQQKFSR